MTITVTKVGVSIDSELLLDIYFLLSKVKGNIEPENSLGKFFTDKLRPIVPKRNVQVTSEPNNIYDTQ